MNMEGKPAKKGSKRGSQKDFIRLFTTKHCNNMDFF